jgi:hypothetical protein
MAAVAEASRPVSLPSYCLYALGYPSMLYSRLVVLCSVELCLDNVKTMG